MAASQGSGAQASSALGLMLLASLALSVVAQGPTSQSPPTPISSRSSPSASAAVDEFAAVDPDPQWKQHDNETEVSWGRTNGLGGGGSNAPPRPARLGRCGSASFVVSKTGNLRRIQTAVDRALATGRGSVTIRVMPGTYTEKVTVKKGPTRICLLGSGSMSTRIVWNDNAGKTGTFGSCTLCVENDGFVGRDFTVQNNARWSRADKSTVNTRMAVASRCTATGCQFYNCRFLGVQDTLYAHRGVQYYQGCYIEGLVDFVFGNAQALFRGCTLSVKGGETIPGYITAHNRRDAKEPTGFVFQGCTVTGAGKAYLGRPWGNRARVIFLNSYLGNPVVRGAWADWGSDTSARRTVFYAQSGCSGPGTRNWVSYAKTLSPQSARAFSGNTYIGGGDWLHG